jgi:methyl-accepting chemotaxis protein
MTSPQQITRIARKLFITQHLHSLTAIPIIVYMMGLTTGLSSEEAIKSIKVIVPPMTVVLGIAIPYYIMHSISKWALGGAPGTDTNRLVRILKAPRVTEVFVIAEAVTAAAIYSGGSALYYGKNPWLVLWTVLTVALITMLLTIQMRLEFERTFRPFAIEEFHKRPDVAPRASGYFWPRQRWYLPYAFGVFVTCTIAINSSIVGRQAYDTYLYLTSKDIQLGGSHGQDVLRVAVIKLVNDTILPLALLGGYLLLNAALAAWRLARQQTEAAQKVQGAMEALASGNPQLPEWVSTDEIGDLAVATARVFEQLKAFSLSLGESAFSLKKCAEELGSSTSKQTEVLTLQATALQETQVTAQEIKQTSALASQKAESVLQQTERADEISNSGEAAIQRSLNGLQEIGDQVREMAKRIKALDERTRQIANITTTVKDLADQSNMLALNAAIEAVRSGEHGKGFGVVAREIRALADQSIQATNSVREILQDISTAITTTVSITEKGSEKVEASLVQVREFGSNIRQLSSIVRDNAASVRQITAAVTQQNAGIGQIFQAVNDLSKIMDQTMAQLRASDNALMLVRGVAEKVTGFVGNYDWKQDALHPPAPTKPS